MSGFGSDGHEFLVERWRELGGVQVERNARVPSVDELRRTEWVPEFEELMRNRLVVGGMRHTRFGDPRKGWPHRDNWAGMLKKVELYRETGNAEYLVDVANYCMVLWAYPQHPNHHFAATDRIDQHHEGER